MNFQRPFLNYMIMFSLFYELKLWISLINKTIIDLFNIIYLFINGSVRKMFFFIVNPKINWFHVACNIYIKCNKFEKK
jgi:hypothetical protein